MAATIEPQSVAELLADGEVWRGPSGEFVTGESTARHVEATAALLEREGWIRAYNSADAATTEAAPGDSSTLREMVRWLVRVVRSEYETTPARTLGLALSAVSSSASGDADTLSAAEAVISAVIRARTGARHVAISAWAGRLDRTWPQVRGLLADAADAARAYGPAA